MALFGTGVGRVCAVVAAMMFMGIAYGQVDSETKVIYKQVTKIDGEGVDISAGIKMPSISWQNVRMPYKGMDMINLKKDFNKELIASTDKL